MFKIRGQTGALPLLQFTLDQLLQRRSGHQLTLPQSYREIGGVKGALSQHAEETYQALPSDEYRQMARDIFLRLIEPGKNDGIPRRRAPCSRVRAGRSHANAADAGDAGGIHQSASADHQPDSGKTTIEVKPRGADSNGNAWQSGCVGPATTSFFSSP